MKEKIRVIVILLVAGLLVTGFIWLNNSQTASAKRAEIAANQLLGSMTYLGQLPWSTDEYDLRAVIVCNEMKLFVTNGKKLGTSALGCGYLIADGINVEAVTTAFGSEGYISFQKNINE